MVEHVSPIADRLRRGDVVTCVSPDNPKEHVCKRILAMESEKVVVYDRFHYPHKKLIKVPEGHVWLQGDNPAVSKDSRMYGPVPRALVKGRVVVQIWPPDQIHFIEHKMPASLAPYCVHT